MHDQVPTTARAKTRQVDLLRACLDDIIQAGSANDVGPGLEPAAQAFWPAIAFRMHEVGAWELPADTVSELIQSVLADAAGAGSNEQAAQVLRSLESSGLFVENRGHAVRFLSPVWRDYLAACHVAQHKMQSTLVAHMNDRTWAPVISIYTAVKGTESLLRLLDASGQKLNDVYQAAAEGLALNGTVEDYRSLGQAATSQAFNAKRSALAGYLGRRSRTSCSRWTGCHTFFARGASR